MSPYDGLDGIFLSILSIQRKHLQNIWSQLHVCRRHFLSVENHPPWCRILFTSYAQQLIKLYDEEDSHLRHDDVCERLTREIGQPKPSSLSSILSSKLDKWIWFYKNYFHEIQINIILIMYIMNSKLDPKTFSATFSAKFLD